MSQKRRKFDQDFNDGAVASSWVACCTSTIWPASSRTDRATRRRVLFTMVGPYEHRWSVREGQKSLTSGPNRTYRSENGEFHRQTRDFRPVPTALSAAEDTARPRERLVPLAIGDTRGAWYGTHVLV